MQFSNSYIGLGEGFYQRIEPTEVATPELFLWNGSLANRLGVPEDLQQNTNALANIFSGNSILPGAESIALAYAGHQFGHFVPKLGDGRAHLLGEVIDETGQRLDIQLKGSGPTYFSRGGDGRCALGPAVREYIMSEAMAALGIPTSRCLAVVTTGEQVIRRTVLPGAVVTRIAASHIRVGTFEYFAAQGNREALKKLFDYTIDRHYPDINDVQGNRYVLLIQNVIEQQIKLIVQWMRVGFIHGVMNTDNTAISGETIDYGPCAMMGQYDPNTVFSSIDDRGRYAFGNQSNIAQWNMAQFAQCLMFLIDEHDKQAIEQIQSVIEGFTERFQEDCLNMMAGKFGFYSMQPKDEALINAFLDHMQSARLDYTMTFDRLTNAVTCDEVAKELEDELKEHFVDWQQRIGSQDGAAETIQERMRQCNPVVIPRNHHVEAIIQACETTGTTTLAHQFLEVLQHPYEQLPQTIQYQTPPADKDQYYQTFCGT